MFIPGKPFQPSLTFVSKPSTLPRVEHLWGAPFGKAVAFIANITLRFKGLTMTNTSLLRKFVNYGGKKFYNDGPRDVWHCFAKRVKNGVNFLPVAGMKLDGSWFREHDGRPWFVVGRKLPLELSVQAFATVAAGSLWADDTERSENTCWQNFEKSLNIHSIWLCHLPDGGTSPK